MNADDVVRLETDVRAQPLVNGMRAWPHLLPPHNLARVVAARHLPIVRSLLDDAVRAAGRNRPSSCVGCATRLRAGLDLEQSVVV